MVDFLLVEFPYLGIKFPINRIAFSIGEFGIYWYSLIIGSAIALCVFLAARRAPKANLKSETIVDFSMWSIMAALIGARLYYCAFNTAVLNGNWLEIFNIRGGGMAIYGGIIGAMLMAFAVAKIKKISFIRVIDFSIPYLALGQAIGRWGNFFNQEAFGTPTDLPWAMKSQNTVMVLEDIALTTGDNILTESGVHPTFLYESIACLILFFVLKYISGRGHKRGLPIALYMVGYGVVRFFIESIRTDSLMLGDLRVSQVLSLFIAVTGAAALIFIKKHGRPEDFGVEDVARISDAPEVEISANPDAGDSEGSEENVNEEG